MERVRGGKAGVKRLRDPARKLLQGENLASNVNPAMFSIAHTLARKVPWLDRARKAAVGVGRLTRYPATYTRRNAATGKLEVIERAKALTIRLCSTRAEGTEAAASCKERSPGSLPPDKSRASPYL